MHLQSSESYSRLLGSRTELKSASGNHGAHQLHRHPQGRVTKGNCPEKDGADWLRTRRAAPLLQCHAFYPRDTKTQRHRVATPGGKQRFLAGEKNGHKASTSGHLVREKIHKSHHWSWKGPGAPWSTLLTLGIRTLAKLSYFPPSHTFRGPQALCRGAFVLLPMASTPLLCEPEPRGAEHPGPRTLCTDPNLIRSSIQDS